VCACGAWGGASRGFPTTTSEYSHTDDVPQASILRYHYQHSCCALLIALLITLLSAAVCPPSPPSFTPHRDLKMDNTLLDDNDPPRIKLCDFGFAKWWTDKPCMSTITGETGPLCDW
jgi:serine/threonine protein kinase